MQSRLDLADAADATPFMDVHARARDTPIEENASAASAMLELACSLWRLGYSPFPLGAQKKPLVKWGRWRIQRPALDDVVATFRSRPGASGIATVCGKPHNLVVVDADDADAAAWIQSHLETPRWTRTRRGLHAHFRHAEDGLVPTRCEKGGGIELAPGIRADVKGYVSYVVAPGSLHPSAFVYEALGDWTTSVAELPVLPSWIAERCKPKPIVRHHRPRYRRRGDDDAVAHFENYLRKRGGVPPKGSGSDNATFRAASYAKRNIPELAERQFIAMIQNEQPGFDARWIASKWRSATGRSTR